MLTFKQLQDEVKRRATRNQGGTTYDDAIKNTLNTSLFRIAREAPWRPLRRKTRFSTVTSYTKGTGYATATTSSTLVTVSSASFITDGVRIERRIKISGSGTYYTIASITGETTLNLTQQYTSSTTTGNTYEILPQSQYNLPIQAGHRMFMWHEGFGYPFKMNYTPEQYFYEHGVYLTIKHIPTHYRMWGEDMVIEQLKEASILTVVSSDSSDTNIQITIFGIVSGYPDYEIITTNATNGTTSVNGTKSFTTVERVVKSGSTTGRITVTGNSGNTTVAVIPVGDITRGILYKKIDLYPLPNKVMDINVQYYKDPYMLVNDGDIHELGQEFDEALILWTTAKIKAEDNQAESDRFTLLFQDELKSLRRTNMDKIDWFPRMLRPRQLSSDALVAPGLLYRQAGSNFGPAARI